MTTRIEAEIKDFQLKQDEEDNDIAYLFRIKSSEAFYETMGDFKGYIKFEDRTPHVDKNWLWEVKANAYNYKTLCRIFDNFHICYETAKSQLRMF